MSTRSIFAIVVLALGTLVSSEAPYAATTVGDKASEAAALLKDSTKESAKEDALEEAALTEAAMQDDIGLAGIADKGNASSKKEVVTLPPKPAALAKDAAGPEKKATPLPVKEAAPSTKAVVRPHLRGQAVVSETQSKNVSKPQSQYISEKAQPKNITDVISAAAGLGSKGLATGMEKVITDLVLGKASFGFGGTPMGKSVKQIMDLIEKDMMPKVLAAHTANQRQLDELMGQINECAATKTIGVGKADKKKATYLMMSPLHKTCRAGEAGKHTEKSECNQELRDKTGLMKLKCKEFAFVYKKYEDQNANRQIVKKGGQEHTESYLKRITSTVCGKYEGSPGLGGGGKAGFLDVYMIAKEACHKATNAFEKQTKKCKRITKEYRSKKSSCDNLQDQMDGAACKRAIGMKDACETYAECYYDKKKVYVDTEQMVKIEEKDRQAEWRGLKRMQCLMTAFTDGKVTSKEVATCRKKVFDVGHLVIKYPVMPKLDTCKVPERYPTTAQYKMAEFAMLPAMAKGRTDANECTGVIEIPTKPAKGSPKTCKCERMTLNGPYSAGPLVRCSNCREVRRSTEPNSCPFGTKIFSPRSALDWKTIFASVGKLSNPHFIVDITRPKNNCGGCTKTAMHSGHGGQGEQWQTSDGSPWWLRSKPFKEPNGGYQKNCYMALFPPWHASSLNFKEDGCKYSAKSYYCQLKQVSTTPKKGSPASCKCEKLALTGTYSAGALIKCTGCWTVSKSTEKNSCPQGTKLFSPASPHDWKTFLASAKPLRSPSWIIDITRTENGCGGCTKNAMNSKNAAQGTWRTSDGSPWFLRSTRYSEPNGDYHANCYLGLNKIPVNENSVTFNDLNCRHKSNAYYCQPVKRR
jgi:hypothetical protein